MKLVITLWIIVLGTLLLMTPFGTSTTAKPSGGYDIAACGTNIFMAVHFDILGDDLNLTMVNDVPGQITVLSPSRLYVFKDENKDGRHFISPTKKSELILKFEDGVAVGVQKVSDQYTAMIFGFKANGDKLIESADLLKVTCEKLKGHNSFVQ